MNGHPSDSFDFFLLFWIVFLLLTSTIIPMRLAFEHVDKAVWFLNEATLAAGRQASRISPRRRIILPIHRQLADGVQRLVNFLQPGTYVAPHHHPADGFSETIFVISGRLLFLEFSSDGEILRKRLLTGGQAECLVDFVGSVIHTFVCLEADTALLEIKLGPYMGGSDKVFAPWAPPEGAPEALEYLVKLETLADQIKIDSSSR